jgi:formiminotetrahydrofolate cyclodeaminase
MSDKAGDFTSLTIREFLSRANSSEPVPGGGSVAALAGALASSMGQMVLNLTIGKEKYKQFEGVCREQLASLEKAQAMILELMDEDIAAFSEFSEARKLDKSDPARPAKMADAIEVCIAVPQEISAVAIAMLDAMNAIKDKSNVFLLSDLGVAAVLAEATVRSTAFNVRANLSVIKDQKRIAEVKQQIAHDQDEARRLLTSIDSFLAAKF